MIFHRDIFASPRGAALALVLSGALAACDTGPELAQYDLAPSAWAVARGYPELLPVSYFDMTAITPVDTGNLAGRVAALRARMAALRGPVIPAADRARLLAALARHKPL